MHPDTHDRPPRRDRLGLGRAAVKIATALLCAALGAGGAVGGEAAGLWSIPSPGEQCQVDDD